MWTGLKVPTTIVVNRRGKPRRLARSCTRYITIIIIIKVLLFYEHYADRGCCHVTELLGLAKLYFTLLDYAPIPLEP